MSPLQPSAKSELSAPRPINARSLGTVPNRGDHSKLSLLGLAAIIVPPFAGFVATVFLGWLFLMAGIVGLLATFRARQAPGFGWSLLSALVAAIAGAVLLWDPFQGLVTLTYVLIGFFIVDGILISILSIAHRRELSGKSGWMMVNGVIDLILAAVVIFPAFRVPSPGCSASLLAST
jgi:uncharacterized membrane protein HdeD (DUF308 family)